MNLKNPSNYFFHFLIIEGDVDMAENYYNSLSLSKDYDVKSSLKRKFDGYFPPTWQKVWLDSNFKNIEEEKILNLLNSSLIKHDKKFYFETLGYYEK